MKHQPKEQHEQNLTIWHFILFLLTAILILLVWNILGTQIVIEKKSISFSQEIPPDSPLEYTIPFEKTPLPSTYKKIEKNITLDTQTNIDQQSYSITRYLEPLPGLTTDIMIQDFTEELRFPEQMSFTDITLEAHQGSLFPNKEVQIGSHGTGAQEVRNTSIHIILINIDQQTITEPIPLYTLTFESPAQLEEIAIANTLFKVGTYTLKTPNTSFVFTK